MYNYPLVSSDGRIACLIKMTRPHVVVFDPATQQKYQVGPVATKCEPTLDLRRGTDGTLYIISSLGNYRIFGTHAVSIDAPSAYQRAPTLPDGSTFRFSDASEQLNRKLSIRSPNGSTREFHLDYKASGSDVFYIHTGPDNRIYGSSILPLHLFRYSSETNEMVDLGKCSTSWERPTPWRISTESYTYLPILQLASPYTIHCSPIISVQQSTTILGTSAFWTRFPIAHGLLLPDPWGAYGWLRCPITGFGVARYLITNRLRDFVDPIDNCGGRQLLHPCTSEIGGPACGRYQCLWRKWNPAQGQEATLFLWDAAQENKIWEGKFDDRKVSIFNALLVGPDGRLFGTVRGGGPDELFVFDSATRTFTHRITLPDGRPLDLGHLNGPDGMIYGFTTSFIYRLDPTSLSIEEVLKVEGGIQIAGPILNSNIYFSTGATLRSAKIF
jgi:hypothetical protein